MSKTILFYDIQCFDVHTYQRKFEKKTINDDSNKDYF